MNAIRRLAAYAIPPLLCLAVYWRVPFIWFRIDDFAWLGMWQGIHSAGDFFHAMFDPHAQGTIRFLSERLYFIAMTAFFGLHSWPFRVAALGTWALDLVLIQTIGARLTRSRLAGFLAAILWAVADPLSTPLLWASAYNELLIALLVLAAFYSRLRWLESGHRKWRWAEAAAFLLGFGALETIVVYPAIVLAHAWFDGKARTRLVSSLWMWIPASLFAAAHLFLIPKDPSPIYKMYFDARLPGNFLRYLGWTIGPSDLDALDPPWETRGLIVTALIGAALLAFVLTRLLRGRREVLFYLLWFAIFLAPTLPLANHVFLYYLTIPGIGLAWLAGDAIASAVQTRRALLYVPAMLLAAAYFAGSALEADAITGWHLRVTSRMRTLIHAVEESEHQHPGSTLVLQGIDDELFGAGFRDDPFRLVGADKVYLAPGDADTVLSLPLFRNATRFRIAPEALTRLLESNQARVLSMGTDGVRDVTQAYRKVSRAVFAAEHRNRIETGDPLLADRLGEGWYPIESHARWTGKRATVTIAGPHSPSEQLRIEGYASANALAAGPLRIQITANGTRVASVLLLEKDKPFSIQVELPKSLAGVYSMPIGIECERTFRPPSDPRDLGIVITKISVE